MGHPDDLTSAEEVFADWLARREVGEVETAEALVHAHPDLAAELAELLNEWRAVSGRLDELKAPLPAPANGGPTNGGPRAHASFVAWLRRILGGGSARG